jgi:hypothetical protein
LSELGFASSEGGDIVRQRLDQGVPQSLLCWSSGVAKAEDG